MMKNIHFCVSGGCEIPFKTERPNFCPFCGAAQLSTAKRATPIKKIETFEEEDDEESYEDDIDIDISKVSELLSPKVYSYSGVSMKEAVGTETEESHFKPLTQTQLKERQRAFKKYQKNFSRIVIEDNKTIEE